MSDAEAARLQEVGKQLASKKDWWGADTAAADSSEVDESAVKGPGSVVRCSHEASGKWNVTFTNVVGTLAVGELQFNVQPKIGWQHFLYLAERSSALPRLDDSRVALGAGQSLRDLMIGWFLTRSEALIRADLLCDYNEVHDRLPVIKGRLNPRQLAIDLHRGKFLVDCEFDDFTVDTPHNRVLRHATQLIVRDSTVEPDQRRRARAITMRMDGVGPLQRTDVRVGTDRRSGYYSDALLLAKALIDASYRSPTAGHSAAWSFLLPGPALVEDGLRNILAESLRPDFVVEKKAVDIGNGLRLNADLVFSTRAGTRLAVGDIKYKLLGNEWSRPHIYQAVTFAEGYGVSATAVLGFSKQGRDASRLQIGAKDIASLNWNLPSVKQSDSEASVDTEHLRFVDKTRHWLESLIPMPLPEHALSSATTR